MSYSYFDEYEQRQKLIKQKNNEELKEVLDILKYSFVEHKDRNRLFQRLKNITDHDHWYSKEEREELYQEACLCNWFTEKQLKALSKSSLKERNEELYDYDDSNDSDDY